MNQHKYLLFIIVFITATGISCSSTSENKLQPQEQLFEEAPSIMNLDGAKLISKNEAKGFILENFDKIDLNGDDNLSQSELKMFKDSSFNNITVSSQTQPKIQIEQSQKTSVNNTNLLNTLDTNVDNQISKSEAKGPILQMFDKLDKDGNGMLNEEEINISMNTTRKANPDRSLEIFEKEGSSDDTNTSKVIIYDKDTIDDGYNLIAPIGGSVVSLYDMDLNKVFSFDTGDKISLDVEILEDGSILGSFENEQDSWNDNGNAGIIKLFNNEGNLRWTYNYSSDNYCSHHDVLMMKNGNVAFIAWNKISNKEAIENGVDSEVLKGENLWPDSIVEVNPTTNEIVWTWNSWDHIIQDINPEAKNYGKVSDNPNLIDINYPRKNEDVMHCNGIEYDSNKDVFYLSSMTYGEIWVIDHSTTTEEASSHKGGEYGVGGDLVYRFGNPRAYENSKGEVSSSVQHAPTLTNDGSLLIFVNKMIDNREQSEVIEFDLTKPFELITNNNNEPPIIWSFTDKNLYSKNTSSAKRLRNGNTLICEGDYGLWEVSNTGEIVWKIQYKDEIKKNVALFQSERYYYDSIAVANLGIDKLSVK